MHKRILAPSFVTIFLSTLCQSKALNRSRICILEWAAGWLVHMSNCWLVDVSIEGSIHVGVIALFMDLLGSILAAAILVAYANTANSPNATTD